MSLQDEQTPIFQQLASALVEATPEWWTHASLELVAPPEGFGNGLSHSIYNSDFPQDVVVPTDEILEATRLLELASTKHSDSWKRCVFRIQQEGESWGFTADFER
jgi:hypothetical protein